MKYNKEERLAIGRRIYDGEINRNEAAEEYNIGEYTARDYMRMYRDFNHLPPKTRNGSRRLDRTSSRAVNLPEAAQLEALTKDELIQVILKAGVTKNKLNQIIRKRV